MKPHSPHAADQPLLRRRLVKPRRKASRVRIRELNFTEIVRYHPNTRPRVQVCRSKDLIDGLRIAHHGETESIRCQPFHSGPIRAQKRPAGEVGRNHPALGHGKYQRVLRAAGVAAPIDETLPGIRHGRQRDRLIGRISARLGAVLRTSKRWRTRA